jgi:transglutaminase-like putative cysteine protease
MKPESNALEPYLASTDVIDWRSPAISDAVRSIVPPGSGDVEAARRLFEWARDRIPHSNDARLEIVTCKSSDVLRHGTGICYAKSHLLAAMLRASGIPAGFSYQILRDDLPDGGMVLHGFNGLFLKSLNRWIRVDSRGNTGKINAQFSLEEEQLAFWPDPHRGELTDDRIFASPLPAVIQCLTESKSVSAMWPNLPNALPDL